MLHDDLPTYFDLDDPEPAPVAAPAVTVAVRSAPPVARVRASTALIPVGVAVQRPTPTTVVVQVVPVWPDAAVARVAAWVATSPSLRVGRDRLTVRGVTGDRPCCESHVRVDVHGRGHAPLTIELGCAAWSATRAELHVVPARAVHDRRRYYRAAHALLDRLAKQVRCPDGPVPSPGDDGVAVGARPRPRR